MKSKFIWLTPIGGKKILVNIDQIKKIQHLYSDNWKYRGWCYYISFTDADKDINEMITEQEFNEVLKPALGDIIGEEDDYQ